MDGRRFLLRRLTSANSTAAERSTAAAKIFALFLAREAAFGTHPSAVIDYPDLAAPKACAFLRDAAAYAAGRAQSLSGGAAGVRIVVLTTYADIVGPQLRAAGYQCIPIDMPAGPANTAAFILENCGAPRAADKHRPAPGPVLAGVQPHYPTAAHTSAASEQWRGQQPAATGDPPPTAPGAARLLSSHRDAAAARTLYIEAVNEADDNIQPSCVLTLADEQGRLCGGASASVHTRNGKRYAYLATMTIAAGLPQGMGSALGRHLLAFLKREQISTVHLGTQTAGPFYEKLGFHVDHALVPHLRVRQHGGHTIVGGLVMMSRHL